MAGRASIVVGGDVACERDEGTGLLGEVAELFREADLSFVNLESPLSTRGQLARGRAYFHRGHPRCADGLQEAGITAVSLANNHLMDYGEPCYDETLEVLDARGIGRFGAGANLAEAREPLLLEHDGLRVALLGYSSQLPTGYGATDDRCGVNPIEAHTAYSQQRSLAESPGLAPKIVTWTDPAALARLDADVAAAAERADVVLVYVHWGTSMVRDVHDYQREIARHAIDAGAHAVLGGHQHVICGVEHYRGRPILHCTGNLLFDKWEPHFTEASARSVLVTATIDTEGVHDLVLRPVRCGVLDAPRLIEPSDPLWDEVVRDLEEGSRGLGTRFAVADTGIAVSAA